MLSLDQKVPKAPFVMMGYEIKFSIPKLVPSGFYFSGHQLINRIMKSSIYLKPNAYKTHQMKSLKFVKP